MDLGMRPHESSRNAEGRERRGEEGGERGGNGMGGGVKGSRVEGGEGAKDGSWGQARQVLSECRAIFCDGVFNWGNGQHVMEWPDWGSAEGAADATNGNVLGHLEDLDV